MEEQEQDIEQTTESEEFVVGNKRTKYVPIWYVLPESYSWGDYLPHFLTFTADKIKVKHIFTPIHFRPDYIPKIRKLEEVTFNNAQLNQLINMFKVKRPTRFRKRDVMIIAHPYFFNIFALKNVLRPSGHLIPFVAIWNAKPDTDLFQYYDLNVVLDIGLNNNFDVSPYKNTVMLKPPDYDLNEVLKNEDDTREDRILFVKNTMNFRQNFSYFKMLAYDLQTEFQFQALFPNKLLIDKRTALRLFHHSKVVISFNTTDSDIMTYVDALRCGCTLILPDCPVNRQYFPKKYLYSQEVIKLLSTLQKKKETATELYRFRRRELLWPLIRKAIKSHSEWVDGNKKLGEKLAREVYDTKQFINTIYDKLSLEREV